MEATVGSVGIPLDGVNNVRGSCSLTSKQEASEATNQDKLGYLWRSSSYLVSQDLTDLRIKTLHIKRISLSNQESEILGVSLDLIVVSREVHLGSDLWVLSSIHSEFVDV